MRSKWMSKRRDRTSKRRSEWPGSLHVDFIVILFTVRRLKTATTSAMRAVPLSWKRDVKNRRSWIYGFESQIEFLWRLAESKRQRKENKRLMGSGGFPCSSINPIALDRISGVAQCNSMRWRFRAIPDCERIKRARDWYRNLNLHFPSLYKASVAA